MIKKVIIAAISSNGYIGKDGGMPWHSKEEFAHFKKTTSGNAIVMGRKTFSSIGKPLKNRLNIILTNDKSFKFDHSDVEIAYSLKEAYAIAERKKFEIIFICGGASVYNEAFDDVSELVLSFMKLEIDGDVKFPKYDKNQWRIVENIPFVEFEVKRYKRLKNNELSGAN